MRTVLITAYLDFVNNYLSVERYAEHNGLTIEQATSLLELAEQVNNSKHPEE